MPIRRTPSYTHFAAWAVMDTLDDSSVVYRFLAMSEIQDDDFEATLTELRAAAAEAWRAGLVKIGEAVRLTRVDVQEVRQVPRYGQWRWDENPLPRSFMPEGALPGGDLVSRRIIQLSPEAALDG